MPTDGTIHSRHRTVYDSTCHCARAGHIRSSVGGSCPVPPVVVIRTIVLAYPIIILAARTSGSTRIAHRRPNNLKRLKLPRGVDLAPVAIRGVQKGRISDADWRRGLRSPFHSSSLETCRLTERSRRCRGRQGHPPPPPSVPGLGCESRSG